MSSVISITSAISHPSHNDTVLWEESLETKTPGRWCRLCHSLNHPGEAASVVVVFFFFDLFFSTIKWKIYLLIHTCFFEHLHIPSSGDTWPTVTPLFGWKVRCVNGLQKTSVGGKAGVLYVEIVHCGTKMHGPSLS